MPPRDQPKIQFLKRTRSSLNDSVFAENTQRVKEYNVDSVDFMLAKSQNPISKTYEEIQFLNRVFPLPVAATTSAYHPEIQRVHPRCDRTINDEVINQNVKINSAPVVVLQRPRIHRLPNAFLVQRRLHVYSISKQSAIYRTKLAIRRSQIHI